jgi:putative transposase
MVMTVTRAIRTELDEGVKHRTNQYLNNRIEQDHRGIKGRYGPMHGFKSHESASPFLRRGKHGNL